MAFSFDRLARDAPCRHKTLMTPGRAASCSGKDLKPF